MSPAPRAPRLAELTYEEAGAAASSLALLPVGSTEAHGPHLPLATDVVIAEGLADRLATRAGSCVVLPPITYAVTDYAGELGGTLSLPAETAAALVRDACLATQRRGFRRVCLVNAHLEPAHVETLRRACREVVERGGAPVAFPDCTERRFARTLSDEFKRGACHAGQYETSLVLAARPDLVRPSGKALPAVPVDLVAAMRAGARTFAEAGAPRGYFGDPAAASAEHGEEQYARLVEMCLVVLAEVFPA